MKVYISGPMRGIKQYNFEAFMQAERMLSDAGYATVNPASLDLDRGFDARTLPDDHDWDKIPDCFNLDDIIREDIELLLTCDGLALLDGWHWSSGATAELYVAIWRGMDWRPLLKWINASI